MELIVINEYKLKIVMTECDMREYGLDENEFYCSVTNTRSILEKIIHRAGAKTGFENINSSEKLLLQLYPEKDGGCELYVTRLDTDCAEDTDMNKETDNGSLIPRDCSHEGRDNKGLAFSFENIEVVCTACRELRNRGFFGKSSLYLGSNKKYYLLLCQSNENKKSSPTELLSEFGELHIRTEISTLMPEYGRCVIEREAIETLSEI